MTTTTTTAAAAAADYYNHPEKDYRAFIFAVHPTWGLLLLHCTRKKQKGSHYQLPGGHVDKEEFQAAALTSSSSASLLETASKMAAARELWEETGLDVRHQLERLEPAMLRLSSSSSTRSSTTSSTTTATTSDDDDRDAAPVLDSKKKKEEKGKEEKGKQHEILLLPNEYKHRLFFFLALNDNDFFTSSSPSSSSPSPSSTDSKRMRVGPMDNRGQHLQLKLSVEHSGFVFEPEPTIAAELLQHHSGGHVSAALLMAMNKT